MESKDNIIWITGASSGIGEAAAEKFLSNDFRVAVSARRIDMLNKIQSGFPQYKNNLFIKDCDVSDIDSISSAFNFFTAKGKIDCLVNNAGITTFKSAADNTIDEIDEIIRINLLGSIYAIKTVLPKMLENGKGTIINIISAAAKKVFKQSSAYSASKAGLLAYTDVLREELRESNIRIINVLPGATRTPIWPNDALEKYSDKMMLPSDIADLIFGLYQNKFNAVAEEVMIKPITGDL